MVRSISSDRAARRPVRPGDMKGNTGRLKRSSSRRWRLAIVFLGVASPFVLYWFVNGGGKESGDRLGDAPLLLVFLRHFGCISCSHHVTELAPRLDELHALGVRTLFIGNGTPNFIEGFVERFSLADKPVEITTDPTLESFAAAGLVRSAWATFGPQAIWDALRAWGAGHTNEPTEGDDLQQGGTLLVDERGVVVWYHRNQSLLRHAATVDVVEAALQIKSERSGLLV